MSTAASLRTPAADSPSNYASCRVGRFEWRCLPEYQPLLESGQFDWMSLRDAPGVRRVKRNGHRDVWRIDASGEVLFVKRYRSDSLTTRFKSLIRGPTSMREWEVGHYAARFGVDAVLPVAAGWSGSRTWAGPSLLLTRGVPGAIALCDYWMSIRHDARRADAVAQSTARLVARAHQCGFHHLDMHAGNIIVQTAQCPTPRPAFVDLHNVRTAAAVSTRDIIANLAQLNQWFRRHATRTQRLRFLRAYLVARDEFAQVSPYARNWIIDPRELLTVLAAAARRHAERLWAKRDRRSMRTGRYFARIRPAAGWRGHVLLVSKHPRALSRASQAVFEARDWKRWLSDPTRWTDPTCTEVLKDSHSAIVCRATLDTTPPLPIICKRPLPRSLWKRLLYAVGPSRNMRAWRRANMLLNRDLAAAQPLAVIERRVAGLIRTDSLLITELIEHALDLEAFLIQHVMAQPSKLRRSIKDRLIAAVAGLVRDLAERGFVHRDFKAPNVLVQWQPPYDGRPELTLIDMDGITHRGGRRVAAAWRAAVRLSVSLAECDAVTRTDHLRFVQTLLLHTGQPLSRWKSVWRALAEQADHKARLKSRRRDWKLARYGRE